jgi:hypothetical protein
VTTNINYVDPIVAALAEWLDDCEIDLLRHYALLVLVTGEQTTEQDAHDAWATWRTATKPQAPAAGAVRPPTGRGTGAEHAVRRCDPGGRDAAARRGDSLEAESEALV